MSKRTPLYEIMLPQGRVLILWLQMPVQYTGVLKNIDVCVVELAF